MRTDFDHLSPDSSFMSSLIDKLDEQKPAVGHNIRFFSLDLTNTCWTRSFYSGRGTMLVLCQLNDLELEKYEPVLKAICASIELDDE